MSIIRIRVDRSLCESNEVCVGLCPEVFRIDEGGTMALITQTPTAALRAKVEEAVRSCPRQALSLVQEEDV